MPPDADRGCPHAAALHCHFHCTVTGCISSPVETRSPRVHARWAHHRATLRAGIPTASRTFSPRVDHPRHVGRFRCWSRTSRGLTRHVLVYEPNVIVHAHYGSLRTFVLTPSRIVVEPFRLRCLRNRPSTPASRGLIQRRPRGPGLRLFTHRTVPGLCHTHSCGHCCLDRILHYLLRTASRALPT